MVPAYVAWEACIFVNSILKVEISLDPEGYSSSGHFSSTITLVEGVWDILDTWWWSLSSIILSFDVFVEFPMRGSAWRASVVTTLDRWGNDTLHGTNSTSASRLVRPRPSSDLLDDLIALAGGEERRWKFSTDHSFGGWACFRRFPWSSLQWRRFFLFETSTAKGLKFSCFWRCWVCW